MSHCFFAILHETLASLSYEVSRQLHDVIVDDVVDAAAAAVCGGGGGGGGGGGDAFVCVLRRYLFRLLLHIMNKLMPF